MLFSIYILICSNGAYYTGYTTDLERRWQEHLTGTDKCKYTRSFPPSHIAAYWNIHCDLSMILKIEYAIKQLTKTNKKKLINQPELLSTLLQTKGYSPLIETHS